MDTINDLIPKEWQSSVVIPGDLCEKVVRAYDETRVYPPVERLFAALSYFPPEQTKVVIIGQDPYHGAGQANGLAFAVNKGIRTPGSLLHIFNEIEMELALEADGGDDAAFELRAEERRSPDLSRWARQGVMLLNSILTVEHAIPGSHSRFGWQQVSDAVIKAVSDRAPHCVFLLWGAYAQSKRVLIDRPRHLALCSSHPSGLSWGKTSVPEKMVGRRITVASDGCVCLTDECFEYRGYGRNRDDAFFGSMHFVAANKFLKTHGLDTIDW